VEEYFALQGRFAPLLADEAMLQMVRAEVNERWDELAAQHERTTKAAVAVH
jgi:hypothetical protein